MKETGLEKERKEETMNKPIQKWQKPVDGFVKINSDGAFSANTGGGGGWESDLCWCWWSALAPERCVSS